MVKEIIHDPIRLAMKSRPATPDDAEIAADLLDTLAANSDRCVGMAANMIGVNVRIICFDAGGKYMTMFNPEIISSSQPYKAEEGCLSLEGKRETKRFGKIKVRFENERGQLRLMTFSGFTAQIIQHETDHCNGILI